MSKAILLSIKPKWVAKILNGEKTIEIRKKFPKDYRGWVYIYCTKNGETLTYCVNGKNEFVDFITVSKTNKFIKRNYNGKVVARFWCDNVEHFEYDTCSRDICGYWLDNGQIFKNKGTCLSADELWNYIKDKDGYAIHISKLEIFDEPKELSEFGNYGFDFIGYAEEKSKVGRCFGKDNYLFNKHIVFIPLTKAPQNYCYVESEELK
jgi:predicted transcriptional regulator